MNPDERLDRIDSEIEKHNEAIRGLIVARTSSDSIQEMREIQRQNHERLTADIDRLREAQSATDDKLNILIETVARIIRRENGKH